MIRILRDNATHLGGRVQLNSLLFLVLMVVSACGSAKNIERATSSVDQFHSQFSSEQYQTIYNAADVDFQNATKEADFVALLDAVHRRLGNVQTCQRSNFQISASTGQGIVVTLVYNTTFDQGSGTERFLWRMRDNQPVLLGYHISSNAFVLK